MTTSEITIYLQVAADGYQTDGFASSFESQLLKDLWHYWNV